MYSWVDCLIWAVLGLGVGGITGFCAGIVSAYAEDMKVDDYDEDEKEGRLDEDHE